MSMLLNEIKRICEEEKINFNQFLERIKKKDRPGPVTEGDLFGGRDK